MAFIRHLTGKFIRAVRMLCSLSLLSLRYCFYVLSPHKSNSQSLHEFSQLMVLACRLRIWHGMTSTTEQAYFQWYTRRIYTGRGDIVDLGCWLGSTTIPLAMGLANNVNAKGKIHAYDNFIWQSWMDASSRGTPLEGKFREGESFLGEFERRIAPWKDRIEVCPGDLQQIGWNGGKIEFLLIDAMKSWELTNSIIRNFYPALIPGSSFVLHQDFAHWYTPWIHLTHYRFRHYFEPVYDVPLSGSMVFRLREPIPSELILRTYSFSSFGMDEIDSAFDNSLGLVSRQKRPNVAAAKVMLFVHLGDLGQAANELEKCRGKGLTFSSDLATVEKELSVKTR